MSQRPSSAPPQQEEHAIANSEPTEASQADKSTVKNETEAEYEQGTVLIGLRDGVTIDELNAQLASIDYVSTKSVSEDDVVFGYVELKLADGTGVKEAETMLEDESFVEAAQPNYVYHLADADAGKTAAAAATTATQEKQDLTAATLSAQAVTVNDPLADKQWALEAVKAYQAWGVSVADGKDVTVAVLDSGIDLDHEDFDTSRIVGAYNAIIPHASVDDRLGHGTHVSGIIAATAHNAKGVAGVSYNAKIMPIKVMDATDQTDSSTLARGLQYLATYAEKYNVKVANISIGTDSDVSAAGDPALEKAIAAVHEAKILVVYAAGNGAAINGAYNCLPCDFDYDEGAIGVISVGRNGDTYKRSTFSNYNKPGQKTKDLSAPGETILTTDKDGDYENTSGTSMAAPYVSGIAALLFAKSPGMTPAKARNALCNTTQDLGASGWDNETGYGLVNAYAALTGKTDTPSDDIIDLATATITLEQSSYTYNGAACSPAVTVKANGQTLSASKHYTVRYTGNTNAGTATVIITGTGSCKGTVTRTFTINKAPLTKMTLSKAKFVFDGTSKSPVATVKGPKNGSANQNLSRGSDYTLTIPQGRSAVGTYTYKAVGTGNYTGTVTAKLTISKAKNTLVVKKTTQKLKAADLKKSKQKVKALAVKNWKGKVSYKKKSGSKALTVNKKTGLITVKKKTGKGTYTAKVIVKAAGDKSYKAISKTVTVKVKVS